MTVSVRSYVDVIVEATRGEIACALAGAALVIASLALVVRAALQHRKPKPTP